MLNRHFRYTLTLILTNTIYKRSLSSDVIMALSCYIVCLSFLPSEFALCDAAYPRPSGCLFVVVAIGFDIDAFGLVQHPLIHVVSRQLIYKRSDADTLLSVLECPDHALSNTALHEAYGCCYNYGENIKVCANIKNT